MSTDLEPQALTAEEVKAEREDHRPTVSSPDGTFCGECDYQWPCPTARLLATLDAVRSQPVTSDLVADVRLLADAILGGTSYKPHREAAERIRAALSASESTPLARPLGEGEQRVVTYDRLRSVVLDLTDHGYVNLGSKVFVDKLWARLTVKAPSAPESTPLAVEREPLDELLKEAAARHRRGDWAEEGWIENPESGLECSDDGRRWPCLAERFRAALSEPLDGWQRLVAILGHLNGIRSDGPFMDTLTAEGPWWSAPDPVLVGLYDAIIAAGDYLDAEPRARRLSGETP